MSDKILYYPDENRVKAIEEQLQRGESLTSANEGIALDKYQNIMVTQNPPKKKEMSDNLSVEEKILRDFRDKGEVVWHTYSKSEPLSEMDLDFKVLAAIHSLKEANKLCDEISKYDKQWRDKATEDMNTFMYIFEEIERHLKDEHDIQLPDTVEEIKQLRQELSTTQDNENDNQEEDVADGL